MEDKIFTSGYITQSGPWIPCLKAGQKEYTFTPQELSDLVNRAFADGYQFAKGIYDMPTATVSTSSWDASEETNHGTH